jgi:hypothetical protein
MNAAELRDTIGAFKEAQQVSAIRLEVWLKTQAPAALERFGEAHRVEDEMLRLILGDSYFWAAADVPQPVKKSKLNPDQIEDAKRRRDQGESTASIARGLGVSGHTVRRWF